MDNKARLEVFDALRKAGIEITPEQEEMIMKRFNDKLNYKPKVAIFGKTGAGKSSLVNALFGKEVVEVNDIERCTIKVSKQDLGGMYLYDCPGIGESEHADAEYRKMYKELLPEIDVILWVLKGDDRAFAVDLEFYQKIIALCTTNKSDFPLYFVVNQVDKIEPFRKWDEEHHCPGNEQIPNIQHKVRYVAGVFDYPVNKVVAVSANEKYGLYELLNVITMNLPEDKVQPFIRNVEEIETFNPEDEEMKVEIEDRVEQPNKF